MNLKCIFLLLLMVPIQIFSQIKGCTDTEARNYNPKAVINDGSCSYVALKIRPQFSISISDSIQETSGLLMWNDKLWTMNDDGDTHLYSLDTTGNDLQKFALPKVKNKDWEALAQDSLHIFIGDFGNNVSGNRQDLHILKIEKKALLENNIVIDTISFSFEDQTDFTRKKVNTTNFDCETMLVTRDSLYIVTKEWTNKQARLYALPKNAGKYSARFKASLDVNGLITGGVLLEDKKIIALCGYSKKLQPFLYLLYDYKGTDFFSGNKRKLKVALPFHQIEGIASNDGLHYYMTNEKFTKKPFITTIQQLHAVDLSILLESYLLKSGR